MPIVELWALVAVLLLGLLQVLFLKGDAAQINRNFAETFPLFLGIMLGYVAVDGFSLWSQLGAVVYVSSRYAYAALTLTYPHLRKWAWALSLVGLGAAFGGLLRALMVLM